MLVIFHSLVNRYVSIYNYCIIKTTESKIVKDNDLVEYYNVVINDLHLFWISVCIMQMFLLGHQLYHFLWHWIRAATYSGYRAIVPAVLNRCSQQMDRYSLAINFEISAFTFNHSQVSQVSSFFRSSSMSGAKQKNYLYNLIIFRILVQLHMILLMHSNHQLLLLPSISCIIEEY